MSSCRATNAKVTRQGVRNLDGPGVNRRQVTREVYCGHNWRHDVSLCPGCDRPWYTDGYDGHHIPCVERCTLCTATRRL